MNDFILTKETKILSSCLLARFEGSYLSVVETSFFVCFRRVAIFSRQKLQNAINIASHLFFFCRWLTLVSFKLLTEPVSINVLLVLVNLSYKLTQVDNS